MNMFIEIRSSMNMFIEIGSSMNMFIKNGSLMNMFIDEPFINEHVKYSYSSHPFYRRPAGAVEFWHACHVKVALKHRYISCI